MNLMTIQTYNFIISINIQWAINVWEASNSLINQPSPPPTPPTNATKST